MSFPKCIKSQWIINSSETETETGEIIQWLEIDCPPDFIENDNQNVRWGGKTLNDSEHEEKVKEEAPIEYKNLKQSLKTIPTASEPIVAYLNDDMENPKKIHGHRRGYAAKEIGLKKIRVLVALNISQTTYKFLRDNPESNPSKVFHTPFARARVIYNELGGSPEKERENKIAELCKRNSLTKRQVVVAERRSKLMDEICDKIKITPDSRSSQFKTFETCDQLNEIEFYKLRNVGEFEKLDKLYSLMCTFVKNQIAHDDIKVSVTYLVNASSSDHILKRVMSSDVDKYNIEELRRITAEIRLAQIQKDRPDTELEKSIEREWRRAFELQDKDVVVKMSEILLANVEKFKNLAESMA